MFNFRGRASNNPQSFRDLQRFKNISFKQRHSVKPFEQKLFGPFDSDYIANKTYFPGSIIINTQYPYESNWFINDEYNSKSINFSYEAPSPGIYKISRKDTFDGKFSVENTNIRDFNNIGARLVPTEVRQYNSDGSSYTTPYNSTFPITSHSFQPYFRLQIDNPENIIPVETENFVHSRFGKGIEQKPSRRKYGLNYGIPDTEMLTMFRTNLGGDKIPGYIFGKDDNPIDLGQMYDIRMPDGNRLEHHFTTGTLGIQIVYDEVGLGPDFMYIHDGFNVDKLKAFKGEDVAPSELLVSVPPISTFASPNLKLMSLLYEPVFYQTDTNNDGIVESYGYQYDNITRQLSAMVPMSGGMGGFVDINGDIPLIRNGWSTNQPKYNEATSYRYTFREPITTNIPIMLSTIRMDKAFGGENLKAIETGISIHVSIPDNKLFQQRRNSIHTLYSVVSSLSNPLDSFYQYGDSRSIMFSSTPLSATHWVGDFKAPLSSSDFQNGTNPYKSTVPLQEIKDKYFILKDRTDTEATWNPHWWGYGGRDLFNFSGVSFRKQDFTETGRNNNDNNCTLITPRHGVTARHWYGSTGPKVGDKFLYYDHSTGAALTATIEAVDRDDSSDPLRQRQYIDMEVVRFEEDMQAAGDIKIYKLPKIDTFVKEKTFPVVLGGGCGIFGRFGGNSACYFLDANTDILPPSAYDWMETPELSSQKPFDSLGTGAGVGAIANGGFNIRLEERADVVDPFEVPQYGDFYSDKYSDLVGKEYVSAYSGLSTLSSCFAGKKFGLPAKILAEGDSGTTCFIPLSTESGFELLPLMFHFLPFGGPNFASPLIHEYLQRAIERTGNSEGYTLSTIDLN